MARSAILFLQVNAKGISSRQSPDLGCNRKVVCPSCMEYGVSGLHCVVIKGANMTHGKRSPTCTLQSLLMAYKCQSPAQQLLHIHLLTLSIRNTRFIINIFRSRREDSLFGSQAHILGYLPITEEKVSAMAMSGFSMPPQAPLVSFSTFFCPQITISIAG